MGFSTDAIHAGQHPDEVTGAISTPVYLTSTYAQEELGKHKGYEYGRTHSLTRQALEAKYCGAREWKVRNCVCIRISRNPQFDGTSEERRSYGLL